MRQEKKASRENADSDVVEGFGDEWSRFDQSALDPDEHRVLFDAYFDIFPWASVDENAHGFDLGCGSGRWARLVAPRVGRLHCIDASSEALNVAQNNLRGAANCEFHHASVEEIPLADGMMDFGYSLGVLHHVPDTQAGLNACVKKLKPGAPFLLYLYYAFDNRPLSYRLIWKVSEVFRLAISRLPMGLRYIASQVIAGLVYYPIARCLLLLEKMGMNVSSFPLSFYRNHTFYVMRTDALDRFGTKLEQRFTRLEIQEMMKRAGLVNISFSDHVPFWCAVGYRESE